MDISIQSDYIARGADFNSSNSEPTMFIVPSVSGTIPSTDIGFYALGINSTALGSPSEPMYTNIENTVIGGLSKTFENTTLSGNASAIWLGKDYDNMFASEAGLSLSHNFDNNLTAIASVTKGFKNLEGYISQLSLGKGFNVFDTDFYANSTLTVDHDFFGGNGPRSLEGSLGSTILEGNGFSINANINYNVSLTNDENALESPNKLYGGFTINFN